MFPDWVNNFDRFLKFIMLATLYFAVKITTVFNRAQIQCLVFSRVYSNLPYINLD